MCLLLQAAAAASPCSLCLRAAAAAAAAPSLLPLLVPLLAPLHPLLLRTASAVQRSSMVLMNRMRAALSVTHTAASSSALGGLKHTDITLFPHLCYSRFPKAKAIPSLPPSNDIVVSSLFRSIIFGDIIRPMNSARSRLAALASTYFPRFSFDRIAVPLERKARVLSAAAAGSRSAARGFAVSIPKGDIPADLTEIVPDLGHHWKQLEKSPAEKHASSPKHQKELLLPPSPPPTLLAFDDLREVSAPTTLNPPV